MKSAEPTKFGVDSIDSLGSNYIVKVVLSFVYVSCEKEYYDAKSEMYIFKLGHRPSPENVLFHFFWHHAALASGFSLALKGIIENIFSIFMTTSLSPTCKAIISNVKKKARVCESFS